MSSAEVATRLAGGSGPRCGASLLADAPHRLVKPHHRATRSRSSIRITTSASAIWMSSAEVATRLAGGSGPRCGASLLADAPHRLVKPHHRATRSRSS
ncbi:MAG: hypothetical protein AB8I08_32930, partial [Sandaracinaceae bacterium]